MAASWSARAGRRRWREAVRCRNLPHISQAASSGEIVPFGIVRIGGLLSPTAKIDGIDQRVNADIAVVDTGVDRTHPDLNYAGGKNCRRDLPSGAGVDLEGHGTLVAGVAAAIDDHTGVVGVAPSRQDLVRQSPRQEWDGHTLGGAVRSGLGGCPRASPGSGELQHHQCWPRHTEL
jgi:subtilisin family serine protease